LGAQGAVAGVMDLRLLGLAVATAVLASVLPYTLELSALRRLPRHVFGIMLSLEPVVALLAGVVLLSQEATAARIAAAVLVVAASAGVTLTARSGGPDAPQPVDEEPGWDLPTPTHHTVTGEMPMLTEAQLWAFESAQTSEEGARARSAGAGPRPRARCRALGPGSEPGAVGAVQRRGDRLEGGAGDRPVDAHAPEDPVPDLALDVGGGQRVVALGQGVLGVIEDPHVDLPLGESLDEAVQRAVADAGDLVLLAVDHEADGDAVRALAGGLLAHVAEAVVAPAPLLVLRGQVLVGERVPQRLGADLSAVGV